MPRLNKRRSFGCTIMSSNRHSVKLASCSFPTDEHCINAELNSGGFTYHRSHQLSSLQHQRCSRRSNLKSPITELTAKNFTCIFITHFQSNCYISNFRQIYFTNVKSYHIKSCCKIMSL